MIDRYEKLSRILGYEFEDRELLEVALTHRSASSRNNERLEFLGDAILGSVIAEQLYRRFPDAAEGELSRLRATLVRKETLAEVARSLELGDFLRLGSGEKKSGGSRRDSILADALESIVAAIYLDRGIELCHGFILTIYDERMINLSKEEVLKDPKTRLQEYMQANRMELPNYEIVEVSGKDHAQIFSVECRALGMGRTSTGKGSSRRRAEQSAAQSMLEKLDI
ncbi:MAG: ribonuclease III [Gammaproteobacteria bacterium]